MQSSVALLFATAVTLLVGCSSNAVYDICTLSPDVGSCQAGPYNRWYYDQDKGKCQIFYWGGCGGNENNFQTLFHCQQRCEFTCHLPGAPGSCNGTTPQWYYDSTKGECSAFTWGGCEGNANRFDTKDWCENTCKPGVRKMNCTTRSCTNKCAFGYMVNAVGCPTCICNLNPNQAACPYRHCTNPCNVTYRVDSSGCLTCDCRNCEYVDVRIYTCPAHVKYGPRVDGSADEIDYELEFVFKQDENGCQTGYCADEEELCGAIQCDVKCPSLSKKDKYGCDVCKCGVPGVDYEPA